MLMSLRTGLDHVRAQRIGAISRSRLVLAAKGGLASVLAWYAAHLVPGAEPYAYYGPLGAVVATGLSIAASIRQCVQVVVAICIGAGLAIGCHEVIPHTSGSLAVLVTAGILLGSWKALGQTGMWIPFTGLFVLIIGDDHPGRYVASYVGLTLLGGAIAIVVNILVPPRPLASLGPLDTLIRSRLAERFDDLAVWLRSEHGESDPGQEALAPLLIRLWEATDRTAEARRANPRAPRHTHHADRQYRDAARLERLIHLAQEISEFVSQGMELPGTEPWLHDEGRGRVSQALAETSRCLQYANADLHARREDLAAASRAVRAIVALTPHDDDWLLLSMAVLLRRSLQVLTADEFKQSVERPSRQR